MKLKLLTLSLLLSIFTSSAPAQRDSNPAERDARPAGRDARPETPRSLPQEATRDRQVQQRQSDFVPQNDRERALFEMIRQLRAEVATLRRELHASRVDRGKSDEGVYGGASPREGGGSATRYREDDREPRLPSNLAMQKAQRIFAAYDKNQDRVVSFEEWLAMREGEMTEERRNRERQHFAEPAGDDSKITLEEFYRWTERRSRGNSRDGRSRQQSRSLRE